MYRVHIFGLVISAMALLSFGALVADRPMRVVVWPGTGITVAGTFVSALATAFYYHHGVWGAISMEGKRTTELQQFVDSQKVDTEYVACLVRFGRGFTGLGLLVLGGAIVKWKVNAVLGRRRSGLENALDYAPANGFGEMFLPTSCVA